MIINWFKKLFKLGNIDLGSVNEYPSSCIEEARICADRMRECGYIPYKARGEVRYVNHFVWDVEWHGWIPHFKKPTYESHIQAYTIIDGERWPAKIDGSHVVLTRRWHEWDREYFKPLEFEG
jgi:hypothetical protein